MQITHEEARKLIHFRSDNRLETQKESELHDHLLGCATCQQYSEEIRDAESLLRQTLHKQWNVRPLPLQMEAVFAKVNSNRNTNIFLTMRTALIGIAFVMFTFIAWQSTSNGNITSAQAPLGTLPLIPTPSTQYTVTNTMQQDCKDIKYVIQNGDTLDGIAQKFSVSKESILLANRLDDETLSPSRELVIPFCESTPTSTMHPPTFTITPVLETISTTPG